MNSENDWQDEKYREVYEEELRLLERRREYDQSCTIKDIEGILHNLYIREGQNWEGRGQLADIITSATIAAYEAFITSWKKETSGGS